MIQLLTEKMAFLRSEFIGFSFSPVDVGIFAAEVYIAAVLFTSFFLFGEKISKLFFSDSKHMRYFASVVLGYIVFGTGLLVLGMMSAFRPPYLFSYVLLFILVAFCPLRESVQPLLEIGKSIKKKVASNFHTYPAISIFLSVFILIAFTRLLLPETGVDALWYHSDYPKAYLKEGTMMLQPRGTFFVLATPQLAQMPNVFFTFLQLNDAARTMHILFYLLTLCLLYQIGKERGFAKNSIFALLIFATAPIIIRHAAAGYVDFQWIFLWLFTVLLLTGKKRIKSKTIMLSGIVFGALLSTKLQAIAFFPVVVAYIAIQNRKAIRSLFYIIPLFSLSALSIVGLWYLRAFLLTGNPFYPQFSYGEEWSGGGNFFDGVFSPSWLFKLKSVFEIRDFGVLFYLGIVAIIFVPWVKLKPLINTKYFLFFLIVLSAYLFLPSPFFLGRHLLYPFSLAVILCGVAIERLYKKYILLRNVLLLVLLLLSGYYIVATIIQLPYGFGWADKNKYLTRILENNNSSYFDYEGKFSKHISKNDVVATYRVQGFYYADFTYQDIPYFLYRKENALQTLKKAGFTKLLIKQGDAEWFCQTIKMRDCDGSKFTVLARHEPAKLYLYLIK